MLRRRAVERRERRRQRLWISELVQYSSTVLLCNPSCEM